MATKIPLIDAARCSGCGRCIAACHLGLFAFAQQGWRKVSVLQDSERCSGCGKCAAQCPIDALVMDEAARNRAQPVSLVFFHARTGLFEAAMAKQEA